MERAVEKYHGSQDATLSLSDLSVIPDWNDTLPALKVEDIHGLSEALMGDSEGRQHSPWIWTTPAGVVADGTDAGDKGTYTSNHLIAKLTMYRSAKG